MGKTPIGTKELKMNKKFNLNKVGECGMKSLIRYLLIALLFTFSGALGQSAGTTAFEFLRSQYSPRGAAMGGNLYAIKQDLQAVLYNPAALSGSTVRQWSINYVDHLLDFQGGYLTYAQPNRYLGNVNAALIYFNYGSFQETNEFGEQTGRTFGASEFALSLGFSNTLGEGFDYGLGVKLIHSVIEKYNASAVALDAGLLYTAAALDNLQIGVSLLNLGVPLDNYTGHKEKLPIMLNAGFSKRLAHLPLLLSGSLYDLTASEEVFADRFKRFAVGGEFEVSKIVRLRLGYQNEVNRSVKPLTRNIFNGFSMGLGIFWNQFRLDYAYSNYGELGSQNRLGVTGTF